MGDPIRQLSLAVEASLAVAWDEPARVRPPRWAATVFWVGDQGLAQPTALCVCRWVDVVENGYSLGLLFWHVLQRGGEKAFSRARARRTEKASMHRCRTQIHSGSCHAPNIERSQSVLACSDLLLVALDVLVLPPDDACVAAAGRKQQLATSQPTYAERHT